MKTRSQTKAEAEAVRTHNMITRSQTNLVVVFKNIKWESEQSEPNFKKLTEYAAIIRESLNHHNKNSYFEFLTNKLRKPEEYKKLDDSVDIIDNLLLKLELLPGIEVYEIYDELFTSVSTKEISIFNSYKPHENSNLDIPVAGESEQQMDLEGD
jgi:hypothetical protein